MVVAEPFIFTLYSDKYEASVYPFRGYLCVIPVRTVQWGSVLMALGMTKEVLYRSIVGLVFDAVLSVILVTWLGATGAAWATVATLFGWSVPFSLAVIIARGFGVSPKKTFPLVDIAAITGLCILGALPVVAWLYAGRQLPQVALLLVSALLYLPLSGLLLGRAGYLPPLPASLRRFSSLRLTERFY